MKKTIKLSEPVMIKDQEVKELEMDFTKVTGRVLTDCSNTMRDMGHVVIVPQTDMEYQAMIASKVIGIPFDDVLDLPAADFMKIITATRSFLMK